TGLRFPLIHPLQLSALLWSSYFVGMEAPGRQALFHSVAIDFQPSLPAQLQHRYAVRVQSFDAATSMLQLGAVLTTTNGARFAEATIHAAHRPPPTAVALAELRDHVGTSSALSGKLVAITGSSRGLGASLALGAALHGADIVLH